MEIRETTNFKEIELFAKTLNFQSFLQSEGWAKVKESSKLKIVGLLVLENDQIIGATLLQQRRFKGNISHVYAPRGLIVDIENIAHVRSLLQGIKSYVKKTGAMFVTIDPEMVFQILDDHGQPKKIFPIHDVLEVFEQEGFVHRGFNRNFEALNPRYTFILRLNQEKELIDTYADTYRKLLRRPAPYLDIKKTGIEDMDHFVRLMEATAKREQFTSNGKKHYTHIYETLHPRNMCDLYIVTLNVRRLIESLLQQQADLASKLELLDPSKYKNTQKYENRFNELTIQKNKVDHLVVTYGNLTEESIALSSILTLKYNDTVWTLHGGNHDDFKEFNAALHLYHRIFEDAKLEGYLYADLFGTTGEWDNTDNPVYGIHTFKRRFSGDYVEYIGEFTYTHNKVQSMLYRNLLPLATKIMRKLRRR